MASRARTYPDLVTRRRTRSRRFAGVLLLAFALVQIGGFLFPASAYAAVDAPPKAIVIGEKEPVMLSTKGYREGIEVLTKIDTGATTSSIDYDLARELGIDLDDQPIVVVQSALGEDERRLVNVNLQIAGKTLNTKVTVSDRDDFENKMLVGNQDLDGFLVDTSREQLTSPEASSVESPVAALMEFPPPPPAAPTLLATIPLAAALIVLVRTLIGITTFGLFAPVLLAIAFVQTGLPAGLVIFGLMMSAGLIVQPLLSPLRLPRVARLAVLLAASSSTLLAVNALVDNPAVNATWAAAFPVVVTATIIERFWDVWEQENLRESLITAGWTLLAAVAASPILVAEPVRWMAERAPIMLALLGVVLSISIGSYRGLRLTELRRFRKVGTEGEGHGYL